MLLVTCAIIEKENKILLAQRSEIMNLPLKWEFPGGKVKANETEEDSIIREIKEELNISIKIKERLQNYVDENSHPSLTMIPFRVEVINGEISLSEHKKIIWVTANELLDYDLADADVEVVKDYLKIIGT